MEWFPVEKCEVGDLRLTGYQFQAHEVSVIIILPSVPSKRSLVTACSSEGLFSPGGRAGANPHPPKLALVHLGYQLALVSEDGDARFQMTKHRMTRHQLKTF